MDRNLPSNHHFRLNEDSSSSNDGKIYVFVKLTDSCLRTIEGAIQSNKRSLSNIKATIKFHHNGGNLFIPTSNGEKRNYSFQISPEDKNPEVFECIRQINKNDLESCGLIEQRMNIHAQEDVYSMTRSKVTEFQKNEELNKTRTKEIGESTKTILAKKTKTANSSRASTTTTKQQGSSRLSKSNDQEHLSPQNSNAQSVHDRPLRERLIHFLALRKYRRPDLLLQMKYSEMKDEEKEQFNELLPTMTTQSKTGEYLLLKQIFLNGEINPDWPFYSKMDSILVKKKIQDIQSNAHRSTVPPPSSTTKSNDNVPDRSRSSTILPQQSGRISSNSSAMGAKVPPFVPATTTTTTSESSTNDHPMKKSTDQSTSTNTDDKMQLLSDMLEKLNNAIQLAEPSNHSLLINEKGEEIDENNLDEIEREYNRLAPEYNQLIDYLKKISDKFLSYQEEFRHEQSAEKANKIVEEFLQCENEDSFLKKRQRAFQLHHQLEYLKSLLEKQSIPSDRNPWDTSDDEDHQHLF